MILSCVYIKQKGIYLWGEMRDMLRGIPCGHNTVVSATDNCWPMHMHSGMGVHSEKMAMARAVLVYMLHYYTEQ